MSQEVLVFQFYRIDPIRVRGRIRDLDLKQWWVAEEAGVHKTTLRRWLNGRITRVHHRHLDELARVLDTVPAELGHPA